MRAKTVESLLKISERNIKKINLSEHISVEDSAGRIISEDVVPAYSVPPFARSAVDGFALMYSDFFEKKIDEYIVKNQITAGYSKEIAPLNSGEAAFVTTGAPLPPNADSVVLIEETESYSGGRMIYKKTVEKGSYISPPGDDIKSGKVLFKKGHRIRLCDIAALSGIGLNLVSVYKKPVIGILSGGNELIQPGKNLARNKIYDINSTVLKALVKDAGGIPELICAAEDNLEKLVGIFKTADDSCKYDLIISTGGTGASFLVLENKDVVNFYDLIPSAIEETGKLLFHGVKLVPGKPTSFGVLNHGTPVFALAGWPYSVLTAFDLFIRPYIQKMMNCKSIYKRYPSVTAVLKESISKEPGSRKYFLVKLTKENGVLSASVVPAPKPPSAARSLSPMLKADGSFFMDEDSTHISSGVNISVTLNDYESIRLK